RIGAGSVEERQDSRKGWEKWWGREGSELDVAKLVSGSRLPGLLLVWDSDKGDANSGRVWLCGCDGKPRREGAELSSYCSAQCLPGGRSLICEVKRLSVRGRQDEMLWHWEPAANTEVGIASARQLPDGNTFVNTVGRTLEVGPDGEEVYGWRGRGRVDENYG